MVVFVLRRHGAIRAFEGREREKEWKTRGVVSRQSGESSVIGKERVMQNG